MRTLVNRFVQFLQAATGLALMLMLGVILLQVALRYGFADGLIWGEEFARIMMIGAALVGAAVAHHEGKHIRFDLLEHMLSARFRGALALVAELVVLATAAMLTYFGWELMAANEFQESMTIGISMLYIYAMLPISMGLMTLASMGRLLKIIIEIMQIIHGAPGVSK